MGGLSRQHDRELLDALEQHPSEAFNGETWRVTAKGRDALRGSTASGRSSPAGEFEVPLHQPRPGSERYLPK